jgi:hypothetical protein
MRNAIPVSRIQIILMISMTFMRKLNERLRLRSLSFRAFRKPNLVLFRHPTNANSIASQHLRDIKSAGVLHFVSELRLPLLGQNIDQDEGRRRNRTAVRTGRFNGATTARAFMSLMVKSVTALPTCAMMLVSWSYHSELRAAI